MKQKPVFLNLTQIKLPFVGVLSFLHRVSGLIIFLAFPLLLWLLSCVVRPNFWGADFSHWLWGSSFAKLVLSIVLVSLVYHVLAGVRHLLGDFWGIGHTLKSANRGGIILLLLVVLVSILFLLRLWGGIA